MTNLQEFQAWSDSRACPLDDLLDETSPNYELPFEPRERDNRPLHEIPGYKGPAQVLDPDGLPKQTPVDDDLPWTDDVQLPLLTADDMLRHIADGKREECECCGRIDLLFPAGMGSMRVCYRCESLVVAEYEEAFQDDDSEKCGLCLKTLASHEGVESIKGDRLCSECYDTLDEDDL